MEIKIGGGKDVDEYPFKDGKPLRPGREDSPIEVR
jgi:hypothetical protein